MVRWFASSPAAVAQVCAACTLVLITGIMIFVPYLGTLPCLCAFAKLRK